MRWFYAVANLVILAIVVVGVWRQYALWRRRRHLITAWLTVSLGGIVVSVIGVARGWWSYSEAYIFGPSFLGMPIEGFAFCFIFLLAGMTTLYTLQQIVKGRGSMRLAKRILLVLAGALIFCIVAQLHKERTVIGAVFALIVIALLYRSSFIGQRIFWYWNGVIVAFCLLFYTFLAASIFSYSDAYATGLRINTVPIENLLYDISLLNMLALAFRVTSIRGGYAVLLERRPRIRPVTIPSNIQTAAYHPRPVDTENDTT